VNEWLFAALVLTACLVPCAAVCFFAGPLSGLVALEVSGSLTTAVMMLLAEGYTRQPFIDLAVVTAALSVIGGILFARLLERHL
jgi:multisubunit Na+/H+ antiporter MnhF subunit